MPVWSTTAIWDGITSRRRDRHRPQPRGNGAGGQVIFASSNVPLQSRRGQFCRPSGEVVFAGGGAVRACYKVAALIFNQWEPTDTFGFELGP